MKAVGVLAAALGAALGALLTSGGGAGAAVCGLAPLAAEPAAAGAASEWETTRVAVPADATCAAAQSEAAMVVETRSPEAGLRELVSRCESGDDSAEMVPLMRDLLVEAPAVAQLAADLLAGNALGERTQMRLSQALERGATPVCQSALIAVAGDRRSAAAARERAVRALGNVPVPTAETMQALWSAFAVGDAEGSRSALQALGHATAALRDLDAERYESASSRLQHALRTAPNARLLAAGVEALGQSGDPATASMVLPHLASDAPVVRAAAARALTRLGGSAAGPALGAALERESDAAVRREIARSLLALR